MANLELITGHGESDHISSFDMRASNRATFGKGKYILTDADNMAITVNAVEKTVTIKSGSCMWSGMHIRNERELNVQFVAPATTNSVYLWLHYTCNPSSLVENVEVVSTTSTMVESNLIYSELPDDVTDAYVLFYSFSFNPNSNVFSELKTDFVVVRGMNDYFEESTQKLNAQAAENAQQLQKLSSDVENKLSSFETNMLDAVYDVTKLGSVYVGAEEKYTLTLSELASNFKALIVFINNWPLGIMIPGIHNIQHITKNEIDTDSEQLWIYDMKCKLDDDKRSFTITGQRARFYRETLGYSQSVWKSLSVGNVVVYGIGRVAE